MVHARHPVQGSKKGSAMEIELTDYFTIGGDLKAYSSMDELVDKCAYYLAHNEERKQIAKNGYERMSADHTYPHRIREMLKTLIPIG